MRNLAHAAVTVRKTLFSKKVKHFNCLRFIRTVDQLHAVIYNITVRSHLEILNQLESV